jgi:tetratricopeptide (TPR) repeat protein
LGTGSGDLAAGAGQTALLCNNLAWTLSLAPPEFRNPSQAVEFAHRALELEPANLNYFNTLGLALCRQGELPLAIETLKLSLRGSSMPIFDLYVLALCYQSAGNLRSAADHAARANYLFEAQEKTWNRHARMELQQLREEYARGLKPRNE